MTDPLSPSSAAIALIKRFEGLRLGGAALPDGALHIGYGHVSPAADRAVITEDEAERLLRDDLQSAAQTVRAAVLAPMSQAQFDALVSLCFSIGPARFAACEVVGRLNAGEPIAAAIAFEQFRTDAAGRLLDPLVRRRAAEQALFLQSDREDGAPSPLMRSTLPSNADVLDPPLAERLARILEDNPATAHALGPPSAAMQDDDEAAETPGPVLSRQAAQAEPAGDSKLLAIAAAGALLVALAAFSAASGFRLGLSLFGGPGVLALLIAAYYMFKAPPSRA